MDILIAINNIIGAIFNIKKNRYGFLMWLVGNMLWVLYGIENSEIGIILQNLVFAALAFWGFVSWSDAKPTLFLDFDGTIVDSVTAYCEVTNSYK